jgi:hypothetical protein
MSGNSVTANTTSERDVHRLRQSVAMERTIIEAMNSGAVTQKRGGQVATRRCRIMRSWDESPATW